MTDLGLKGPMGVFSVLGAWEAVGKGGAIGLWLLTWPGVYYLHGVH